MPRLLTSQALPGWRRPGSSYDASSSPSECSGSSLGISDILALPGGRSRLVDARLGEVEHGADVAAHAEPLDGSGQGIREQIGAREPYAGNPITDQDRCRRQIEPVEHSRRQEV